ncbi:MAG TPA: NYN domain-containing protein [Candidatus Omnitrophota bacterium]|nr:NYN domain-containing protein [Candidatus Omnitrophota bacterium]
MSLHYIVDGYNVVRHASFVSRGHTSPAQALARCIRDKRLCGSMKNKVTLVFDGYPTMGIPLRQSLDCDIVFSQDRSADEQILDMAEHSVNPKIMIVVTDDRRVQFHAKAAGVSVVGVEEFLTAKQESEAARRRREDRTPEISAVDAARINKELRNLWLKEK